jgi:hypothetical protein
LRGSRELIVTPSIVGVIAAGGAALWALTDLPLFLVGGIWVAPVVVLISYAYPQGGRRAYGILTMVAALALPALTTIWMIWLILTRGRIGHRP